MSVGGKWEDVFLPLFDDDIEFHSLAVGRVAVEARLFPSVQ